MTFASDLKSYLKAGYPALYIQTAEEGRCLEAIAKVAGEQNLPVWVWTATQGWQEVGSNRKGQAQNPQQALQSLPQLSGVMCLVNFHFFLSQPGAIQAVKDNILLFKAKGYCLVFVSVILQIPKELEKDITVVFFSLPTKEELARVLEGTAESAQKPCPQGEEREKVLNAALGMTEIEAENAFALSLVKSKGCFDPQIILREKAQAVKKSGLLEFVETKTVSVGGLWHLQSWLEKAGYLLIHEEEARQKHIDLPKGVLLVGVPGTGKSLSAKCVAQKWGLPLLRLDMSRIFGSLVGQSESQMREALKVAEAIAPCVLWVDEIEKGLAGVSSSGQTDSGVTARVVGILLTWLQEKESSVFLAATANDVTKLPPELMRAGRFDEVFALDLPNEAERTEIWDIHLNKREVKLEKEEKERLIDKSEGYTGAEIESAIGEALREVFYARRQIEERDFSQALRAKVPTSVRFKEQIDFIRSWMQGNARPATSPWLSTEAIKLGARKGRKIS